MFKMSFGQVPVVTPVGSIPTVVYDNKNGLLVDVRNSDDIVNALVTLNDNRILLNTLSRNAQCTVFEKFDDEKYVKVLNELYN